MAWGFTRDDLIARSEEAGSSERAHCLRWLDREDEALRWFRAAVEGRETRAPGAGWMALARHGCALRRAGDASGARRAFAQALQRAGPEPELEYLLGRLRGGEGLYGALAARDLEAIRTQREWLIRSLRVDRVLPGYGSTTLDRYEQLEETFRVEAEILGEPVPDHATMLTRAGLLLDAPPTPPPPVVPPAAGTWTLPGVGIWKAREGGSAHVRFDRGLELQLIQQFSEFYVRLGDEEDARDGSPLVDSFAAALELAADVLLAAEQDWAVDALAELLAHAQGQGFEVDRALLEADRDGARDAAGRARAHRWLDEPEAARRALAEALGDDREPEERGWLLRLAGDEAGARWAFEQALAGVSEAAARARLCYLLGRWDEAPYFVEDDPVGAVELCDAHRMDRPQELKRAREIIAATIRTGRLLPAGSAVYDWLEETFLAGARTTGEPPPTHAQMLERAGLWRGAPPPPPGPVAPRVRGRRVLGDAVLEVDEVLQLSVTFGDGLELEFGLGTLDLWRGEEHLARREGYRSLGEELAAAEALVSPAHIATILALLDDADPAIHAENELSLASAQTRATFERLRAEAEAAGDLAALARALRWLGDEEESTRCFHAAAQREGDPARRGGLLWTAGDRDGARAAFGEALTREPGSSLAFELRCLLGDAPGRGHSDRAQVVSALSRESLHQLPEARDRYKRRLFRERVLITDPGPTLAPYDLVWEANLTHYAITGSKPPHHKAMLTGGGFYWAWDEE